MVTAEARWLGVMTVGGQQFRYGRDGTKWVAARRCDCLLGPHWHDLGVRFTTRYELEQHLSIVESRQGQVEGTADGND